MPDGSSHRELPMTWRYSPRLPMLSGLSPQQNERSIRYAIETASGQRQLNQKFRLEHVRLVYAVDRAIIGQRLS